MECSTDSAINHRLARRLCRLAVCGLGIHPDAFSSGRFACTLDVPLQVHELHIRTSAIFKRLVERHGWPLADTVGYAGAAAAWLLAMHSHNDLPFMRECRDAIAEAAMAQQGQSWQLAYMEDRLSMVCGEPQRYGTHVVLNERGEWELAPLLDERRVELWRRMMGLPSLLSVLFGAKRPDSDALH
ncbi:TPA: hypothetical protein NOE00_002082 [Pseudomonas aeruginosa]|nr:hypothetical protein [Pseudomonas aeruginosa]